MKSKITITKRNFLTFITCCLFALSINAQTSPVVVSTVPAHNATNVNVTDAITVTFDQPIQAGLPGKSLTIWSAGPETVYASFTTSNFTISGNTITLNASLPYARNMYISLENGLIKNSSDQYNATYGFASGWLFTTENDTYSPTLIGMTPPDNSVGIFENSNILSYSFDENVQAGSGNIIVRRVDNDAVALNADVTNPSEVIVSGSSFTIVSTSTTFDYSTEYYVEFPSGVIEDLVGNLFAGIGASPLADHDFTMRDAPADTSPPTAISYSPADDATGVDVNTDFTITFNENIQIGAGSIFIKHSNGTTVYQIDVSNALVTGSTATFTLPDNLFRLTSYYILIDAGAFSDLAGNDYAGTSTQFVWNFTTANASDITAPTAITLTPSDNATNASISNNLTLDFSEVIQLNQSAVLKDFGGAIIPSTSTVSGSTLTINPTSDLANSTSYYVEIAYGAIRDLAGNSFAGFSGNTTWNFTTEILTDTTPPAAVTYSPLDNATDASISNNIVLTFNEDIQISGGRAILKNYSTNVEIGSSSSTSGNQLIINPTSDLDENTQYYIEIANGIIKDLAGNGYAGFSGNSTWSFTTVADATPPSTTTFFPVSGSTDISVSNDLTLFFTENIQVSGGGAVLRDFFTNVEISSSSTVIGSKLFINPTTDLNANTIYYVEIASGIVQDMAGNDYTGFSGNGTWSFTTGNVLATADFELKQHLSIYPNPTNGILNIRIADFNEDLTIEIFDVLGKKLDSKVFTENNNQIDISDLPIGIYMLRATASNTSYTTRIIKR